MTSQTILGNKHHNALGQVADGQQGQPRDDLDDQGVEPTRQPADGNMPSHPPSEANAVFNFSRSGARAFSSRIIASIMGSWISGHFDSSLL